MSSVAISAFNNCGLNSSKLALLLFCKKYLPNKTPSLVYTSLANNVVGFSNSSKGGSLYVLGTQSFHKKVMINAKTAIPLKAEIQSHFIYLLYFLSKIV